MVLMISSNFFTGVDMNPVHLFVPTVETSKYPRAYSSQKMVSKVQDSNNGHSYIGTIQTMDIIEGCRIADIIPENWSS